MLLTIKINNFQVFQNYNIDFADKSSILVEELPVNSQDIISIIATVYPQANMISNAISVSFKTAVVLMEKHL